MDDDKCACCGGTHLVEWRLVFDLSLCAQCYLHWHEEVLENGRKWELKRRGIRGT